MEKSDHKTHRHASRGEMPAGHEGHEGHGAHEHHASQPHAMQECHCGHSGHDDAHACHGSHTEHEGHAGHAGHMAHMGNLGRKFWISLALAIPIVVLSPMMGMRLPFQISFPGSDWIVAALASLLFFYGGAPFFAGARAELKDRRPAMMTLISMGIAVSYIYSLYAFAANRFLHVTAHKMDFFWELSTLIVIMLLGHWLEMKAVGNAGNALRKMAGLLPVNARVSNPDGSVSDIPLQRLEQGQLIIVRAGEKMPADGEIVSGETTVDESMITGEAKRVAKQPGDKVTGGSVNGDGSITVTVTGTGETGYLARVMKLVQQAQKDKSRSETRADKVARALFYVALFAGLAAFAVWIVVTGDINAALLRLVTVLIIACPHALGLAIPLVVARSTSLAARNGLLIRSRKALEKANKITVVAMDKTGTLTEGDFSVSAVAGMSDKWDGDAIIKIMAAIEIHSNHPLAAGILNEARRRDITLPEALNVQTIRGAGLSGRVGGDEIKVVSGPWLDANMLPYDSERVAKLSRKGDSISYLVVNGVIAGFVAQGDKIKPEARETVEKLKKQHIEPVMLTGDNESSAFGVAREIGIGDVHAGLLPEDKERIVAAFESSGKRVMMVGDGVNDAPALARADIGAAIGAGTDVAIDSADVVLVKSDPLDIIHFLSLARKTTRKMTENLWWGAGYNIIAIPLAAGVLAPAGILLSPAAGAVLMSASTVIVAVNALALKMK